MDPLIVSVVTFSWLRFVRLHNQLIERKKRFRRWWVKPHLRDGVRNKFGLYQTLFLYFKCRNAEEFFKMMRMTVEQFEFLHNLLKDKLEKSFLRRPPLPSELRLAIVLHYLAHADSIDTTAKTFFVGKSTAYEMIQDVTKIIWEVLSPKFLGIKSIEEWQEVAKEYQDTWDFPNCLGAIDGKHVRIVKPPHSGSAFYNYKKYCSFVLMAACDAKYRFTWIDVGDYGGLSDSCVFESTDFGKLLKSNEMKIPQPAPLPESNVVLPYAFIADEGLTLSNFLINPYPRRKVSNNLKQAIFNYRLSRARMTIENSFGVLSARWRIFHVALNFKLQTSMDIVKATVCLHNFLITTELKEDLEDRRYIPDDFVDKTLQDGSVVPGKWRNADNNKEDVNIVNENNAVPEILLTMTAINHRNQLADYFYRDAGCLDEDQ